MKTDTPTPTDPPFRIAFRREGDYVNCYYADPNTMEGAVLLGSMRQSILRANEQAWEDWKKLMVAIVGDAAQRVTGERAIAFKEVRAPEKERSGHG